MSASRFLVASRRLLVVLAAGTVLAGAFVHPAVAAGPPQLTSYTEFRFGGWYQSQLTCPGGG